jgi:hypothetical protein
VEPYLQRVGYVTRVRILTGFAARVRRGCYGRGKRVQASTVSSAVTAIGQEISLACEINPTKIMGSEKLVPRLQQTYDGWRKEDPPTTKMLPVESDVPEWLVAQGLRQSATELDMAVGDLTMVAFYYLLRVGEYTIKGARNDTKQTVQFKLEDVTFFKKNATGKLCCLPRGAPDHMLMTADGATLKLDNQKNGWKGVCVYHEANGDPINCPVRALGRRIRHIRAGNGAGKTFLSAYYVGTHRFDVTAENISQAVKGAARALSYPATKGIPIERINTQSLRSGGANALALSGYTDTQIQKMGRWRGATFKEYIREELAVYSENMSRDMRTKFGFVNIAGNAFHDVAMETLEFD